MSLLPRILAVVGPLVVLGGAAWLLQRPADLESLGAEPRDVRGVDKNLKASGEPALVLLGNSKVGSDLDLPTIASTLGVEPRRVVAGSVNGTGIAVWYAVLETRVYGAGYRPDYILVYGPPTRLLEAEPRSPKERAKLDAQLVGLPAEEADRIRRLAGVNPAWDRAVANGSRWHDQLVDGWRNRVLDALLGFDEEKAEAVLASVFTVGTSAGRQGALPVTAEAQVQHRLSPPGEGVLAALVARAQANGAQVVVIAAPVGDEAAGEEHDPVPRATLAELGAWLHAHDAGWVDLSESATDADFGDGMHMSSGGRERFRLPLRDGLTRARPADAPAEVTRDPVVWRLEGTPSPLSLVQKAGNRPCAGNLNAWRYLESTPARLAIHRVDIASPFTVTSGERPLTPTNTLGDIQSGCKGAWVHQNGQLTYSLPDEQAPLPTAAWSGAPPENDAAWIYPGTSLVGVVSGPVRRVWVDAVPMGGKGATVTIGEEVVPVAEGGVWLDGPFSDEASLRVTSPADGPLVLVRRIAAAVDGGTWYLMGRRPLDVITSMFGKLTAAAPPPVLPPLDLPPPVRSTARPEMYVVPAREIDLPNDEEVKARSGVFCSPIDAARDGVPVSALKREDGRLYYAVTLSRHEIHIVTIDGAPPVEGATWTYSVDATRDCKRGGIWVYGGDRLDLEPRGKDALPPGATRLDVLGQGYGDVGETRLRLTVGDTVLAEATVPAGGWGTEVRKLEFPAPVEKWTTPPVLHVEMDGTGFLLLSAADLVAPAVEPFAEPAP